MADDPRINWTLANSYGIWMNQNPRRWNAESTSRVDQWNSGRATDVLCRDDGNLVVASANGGIWLVSDGGTVCVSDQWPHSAFASLAQGPDHDQHIFAGGFDGALYMTDLSRLAPMLDWIGLESPHKSGVGSIFDILVLSRSRVIVLACDQGVFWSRIPPPPARLGPPATDSFRWLRATVEGDLPNGFLSLAEGPLLPGMEAHPSPNGAIMETIMAGGLGGSHPAGLFWGQWDKPDSLVLRRSHLFNQSTDVTLIHTIISRSVVASFALNHHVAYAACTAEFSDCLLVVFKTVDGGRTWNALEPRIPGLDLKKTFADTLGSTQKGHNLSIGVSNTDPDIVTLGFRNTAISFDGGRHWRKPGFDPTQEFYITHHLHADVTNFHFAHPRTFQPVAPESYFVSSDGGVAQVTWGDGVWCIESDRREDGQHGNFYAVMLDGSNLVLRVRRSGQWPLVWQAEPEAVITDRATGSGCIIQSDFQTGDSQNGNLEVIVPEDNELVHYSCAIQNGSYTNWIRRRVITHLATGPGCIIQSDLGPSFHGNFEVVALEGSELVHYWLDGGNVTAPWNRGFTISNQATGSGCLIQSDFGLETIFGSQQGNLEVIVLEGSHLVHYWHDSSNLAAPWSSGILIHQADSSGSFFQSNFYGGPNHGNFELVFRRGHELMFSFRNNSAFGFPWSPPIPIPPSGRNVTGPGCMFQSSYGGIFGFGIGENFELLVPEAGAVAHHFRDNARFGFPWRQGPDVTDSVFTFRSDFNRKLATLDFFDSFGGSMLEDRALVGALQDNGIVDGVADNGIVDGVAADRGTPWFQLEGGDGVAAFYLSGHSPRISDELIMGRTAVHQNNALNADESSLKGSKSARWRSSGRDLIRDVRGKDNTNVIPLRIPKPGQIPVPKESEGLQGKFLYQMVRSPENFPKGMVLAALAAHGPDLYVLLVTQNQGDLQRTLTLDMHWEFKLTLPNAAGVIAMASADGLTAIVQLDHSANAVASSELVFSSVDLTTGKIVSMPVRAGAAKGSSISISIVSPSEAYAVVNRPTALGNSESKIVCWNGTEWTTRGQPAIDPFEGSLIWVEVDPTQTPPTVFAATKTKVYISRDSARTWVRAATGLPKAIEIRSLILIRDSVGSHLYLPSSGRSVWNVTTKETW